MRSVTLLLIVLTAIPFHTARAWSGAGHDVIAAKAFRDLSPELKAQAYAVSCK